MGQILGEKLRTGKSVLSPKNILFFLGQVNNSKLALNNIGGTFIFLGVGIFLAFASSFIMMLSRKLKMKLFRNVP